MDSRIRSSRDLAGSRRRDVSLPAPPPRAPFDTSGHYRLRNPQASRAKAICTLGIQTAIWLAAGVTLVILLVTAGESAGIVL